jgi:DNA recombination protein RmuC
MDAIAIVSAFVFASAAAAFGFWFGSRRRHVHTEKVRAEGRAEAAVELATVQERVAGLEARRDELAREVSTAVQSLSGLQEHSSILAQNLARAEERATQLGSIHQKHLSTATELEQSTETISELRQQNAAARTQNAANEEKLAGLTQSLVDADRTVSQLREELRATTATLSAEREASAALRSRLNESQEQREFATTRLATLNLEKDQLHSELRELTGTLGQLQATLEGERTTAQQKLDLLASAREDLVTQFKILSADILEEKSQKFAQQNATALGELLAPVKERLAAFQSRVEEVSRTDGQERAALGEQLKQLLTLNQTLSQDAQNLTRALKGDQKTQGTWGEIVLETVLEMAGLVEGTHFDKQPLHVTEDDKRSIPDVVVRLPGDRNLVVDSKVSLTAYERCMSCETPEEREVHVKQHVQSVRAHIKGLSEKKYQKLYELKSLDFVLMFIPLEPAFAAAVSNDNHIFRDAWDRNVILVSPSTLLFVVRTVAYLWRQESQTRHVLEIVKRGAELYDKLCGFVEDFQAVGERLQQAQKAYEAGMKKFATGRGNLVWQAQELKTLGVKPTKSLPSKLAETAAESLAELESASNPRPAADQIA